MTAPSPYPAIEHARTPAQRLTRHAMQLGALAALVMGVFFLAAGLNSQTALGIVAAYDLSTLGLLYIALTPAFIELARAPRRNVAIWRLLLLMQTLDFAHQTYHLIDHQFPLWFSGGWWLSDIGTLIVIGSFGWTWYRRSTAQ